jgi:hypothetical protein
MQCILYKIYFWKVFHMYYNLYALLCGQNFILVKSGCYISHVGSVQLSVVVGALFCNFLCAGFSTRARRRCRVVEEGLHL